MADEGCLICHGRNLMVIYDNRGINYADGDFSWDCEAYCPDCGWYSQWVYDE